MFTTRDDVSHISGTTCYAYRRNNYRTCKIYVALLIFDNKSCKYQICYDGIIIFIIQYNIIINIVHFKVSIKFAIQRYIVIIITTLIV